MAYDEDAEAPPEPPDGDDAAMQAQSERRRRSAEQASASEEDEFRYHTGTIHADEAPDEIEFIDVHKSFGRNHVLRGLNMGLPEGKISMIIGPSGTGKSVCIKHIVGLLYPDEGDVIVQGCRCQACPTPTCSRCARNSACSSRTAHCSAR